MADHPLRPATRLSLGKPLPYQLADGPQAPPLVIGPEGSPSLTTLCGHNVVLCGISAPFGTLSPAKGQITYVLLTRAPLYSPEGFLVRLACVKRAANVRSEPGSNSPVRKNCEQIRLVLSPNRVC